MRKIAIDAFHFVGLKNGSGGSGTYLLSLIENMARYVETQVIASPDNARLFSEMGLRNRRILLQADISEHAAAIRAAADSSDLIYAPFTALPERESYSRVPTVAAIHDLQHRMRTSYFPEPERIERDNGYFAAVRDANGIITFSQAERANIDRFYNVRQNVGVIPHAPFLVEEIEREFGGLELPSDRNPYVEKYGRYILYSAVNWPHKNHYRLIEAFGLLCDKFGVNDLKLVLTGASCVEKRAHFYKTLLEKSSARDRVVTLGFVTNSQLYLLMKGATALAFPSTYEGFGIPVVEALRLGTPVIASDLPVFREWFHGCFQPFRDNENSLSMAEDLYQTLGNEALLATLRDAGRSCSANFSGKRVANDTIEFLTKISDGFDHQKRSRPRRNLASLRKKECSVLFQIRIDKDDPSVIEAIFESIRACISAVPEAAFVFAVPYGLVTAENPWVGELDHPRCKIIFFDDANKGVDRVLAVDYFVTTQIDASFHCFMSIDEFVEFGKLRPRISALVASVLRNSSESDGYYIGERSWDALRQTLTETLHQAPEKLQTLIDSDNGFAIQHFVLNDDFVRRGRCDWFDRASAIQNLLSARIAAPRAKFAYIETELKRHVGHHFGLVKNLTNLAATGGLDPIIGANRECEIVSGLNCPIDFAFSSYALAPEPHVTPNTFADELAAFIERHQLGPKDFVFLHMPFPTLIAGVLQHVITSRLDELPSFLIRICSNDESFRWHDIRQTSLGRIISGLGAARRKRIRIFAESAVLQSYFEEATGERWPVLLNPVGRELVLAGVVAKAATATRQRSGIVTFGYFGEAREEKGFQLLPSIVEGLLREYGPDRVNFRIQVSASPQNATETIKAAKLHLEQLAKRYRTDAVICMFEEFTDMQSYYQALAESDAVILPYDIKAYGIRGSGVAMELLALGTPIVAAAGTDMAATFDGGGCVVAASWTTEAFLLACRHIVDNHAAISSATQQYVRTSELFKNESQFLTALVSYVPEVSPQVPEERMVAIWIGNDVLSQGCSAVYSAQRDFLRRHGYEIYNVYVPFPDLNGNLHSDDALQKYLVANSLGWRENGFDFGCYSWTLNQEDRPGRPEILRSVAEEGGSTKRFLELNSYNAIPLSLRKLSENRRVSVVCLNYVHLLPIVEKLDLFDREGTRIVLETHDIQAEQHAIRGSRAVDEEDRNLEISKLTDADVAIAINRTEFEQIREENPWVDLRFVLPTIQIDNTLSHDWNPGESFLNPDWLDIWCSRRDLQTMFDLRTPDSLRSFRTWIFLFGRLEHPVLAQIGADERAYAESPHPSFPRGHDGIEVNRILGWLWETRSDISQSFPQARDPHHKDRRLFLDWAFDHGVMELGLLNDGTLPFYHQEPNFTSNVSSAVLEALVLSGPQQLAEPGFASRMVDWLQARGQIDVMIVGSDHPANMASIRQFLNETFGGYLAPRGINLLLVGRCCAALGHEDVPPQVLLLGEVARLDPLYLVAQVVAIPTSVGTGTPIKALDALSRGLCVSLPAFVDRALGLRDFGFKLAETPLDFASDIIELLESDEARSDRIALAKRFAAEHLDRAIYDNEWKKMVGLTPPEKSGPIALPVRTDKISLSPTSLQRLTENIIHFSSFQPNSVVNEE